MSTSPAISFVIVSWNARDYLRECLETLRVATSRLDCEILVIDNASTDGSWELVRDQFPDVTLVRNDQNLGFASANNQGIEMSRGKYICMVNSDVHLFPDTIDEIHVFMEEHPDVGLSGPRILNRDRSIQPSCRTFPSLHSAFFRSLSLDTTFPRSRLFGEHFLTHWSYDSPREVEVLSGCFWFARRKAIQEVGLLDTQFFMYGEDIDYCRRFVTAGWRVTFFPGAEAIHYGGGSSTNAPTHFWLEMQRANLQYWLKHHGRSSAVLYHGILVLHHAIRTLGFGLLASTVRRGSKSVEQSFDKNWKSLRWLLSPRTFFSLARGRVTR